MKQSIGRILPGLKYQALRMVTNKSAKELCKTVYKLEVQDYLVAIRKS